LIKVEDIVRPVCRELVNLSLDRLLALEHHQGFDEISLVLEGLVELLVKTMRLLLVAILLSRSAKERLRGLLRRIKTAFFDLRAAYAVQLGSVFLLARVDHL
jgi:hypothetical protein